MDSRAWKLKFNLLVSKRYNQKLRGLFSLAESVNDGLTFFGGAGAAATLLFADTTPAASDAATWLALISAASAAFALIVRPGTRAAEYHRWAREAMRIEQQLNTLLADHDGEDSLPPKDLAQLENAFAEISSEERPARRVLTAICYNEELVAHGIEDGRRRVDALHRWTWRLGDFRSNLLADVEDRGP